MKLNSLLGNLDFTRSLVYCRRCKKGYAPFDRELGIDGVHKITGGLKETVCDFAQRMSSFEEASYMMDKYLGIKVSPSFVQEISEEVGQVV